MKFYIFYLFPIILFISTVNSQYQGSILKQDEKLESKNGKYFLGMQSDGNFVAYSKKGMNGRDRDFPIWNSSTYKKGNGPFRVVMQHDGNLVLYTGDNKSTWASNTNNKGNGPYRVTMQDDGNIVVYDKENRPIWASNTSGRQ